MLRARVLHSVTLALMLLPFLAFMPATARADSGQATLTVLEGLVIVNSTSAGIHEGVSGEQLVAGDSVSSVAGRATLTFVEGSEQELALGTDVVIQNLGPNEDDGEQIALAQLSGLTINRVAASASGSSYQVDAANGTVRGGGIEYTVEIEAPEAKVLVTQGLAEVQAGSQVESVGPCQRATISPPAEEGGEPSLHVAWCGTVWGWGSNFFAQLGEGSDFDPGVPVQAGDLSGVVAIATTWRHSLALRADGTVWGWGNNQANQINSTPEGKIFTPTLVEGIDGVVAISGGFRHSLALKGDGTVWAWGGNDQGQLGNGTISEYDATSGTPAQVSGLSGVVAIASGRDHNLAVGADGSVWSWGGNTAGKLGNGNTDESPTPAQVAGIDGVTAVTASDTASMALKGDGTLWGWGFNITGELGTGNLEDSYSPVPANGVSGIVAVDMGRAHTLALASDGTVWAWGDNERGQLGLGTMDNDSHPVPTQIPGLTEVTAISAGWGHSVALRADGTVWEWGYETLPSPVQVAGLEDMVEVVAGEHHNLAIKE